MSREDFIRRQKGVLQRRRGHVTRALDAHRQALSDGPDRHVGSFDSDAAGPAGQTEIAASSVTAESAELQRIDHALDRHRAGEYGQCEGCGRKIPMPRLTAMPTAARCVTCQQTLDLASQGEGLGAKCGER